MQAPTSVTISPSHSGVGRRLASSTATDGNSKLIGQRLHVAGKSGRKFGKDGSTKEVVRSSCVRRGTVSTLQLLR